MPIGMLPPNRNIMMSLEVDDTDVEKTLPHYQYNGIYTENAQLLLYDHNIYKIIKEYILLKAGSLCFFNTAQTF